MVLQPGADDLLAVVQIFRADEADDGVDQQRLEFAGDGVGAGFAASAGRRRGARRRRGPSPGRSRNTSRCRRACRASAKARPRAPRAEVSGRCRSCGWPPPCRRWIGRPDRPARRASIARSVVVTCASTHDCVGISYSAIISSISRSSDLTAATLSVAGLMPMHGVAAAVEQAVEDRGGDARWDRRWDDSAAAARKPAGQAEGVAKARDDAAFRGDRIRSWFRMSFETAATISGVRPGARAASSPSSSRNPAAIRGIGRRSDRATGAKAAASCGRGSAG